MKCINIGCRWYALADAINYEATIYDAWKKDLASSVFLFSVDPESPLNDGDAMGAARVHQS